MTEVRANYTFVGDDGFGFTRDREYTAFEMGGGLQVVNDEGHITSMSGPTEWWQVNEVKVDGEAVFTRKEEQNDGSITEGRLAAETEAGGEADEEGGKGRKGRAHKG